MKRLVGLLSGIGGLMAGGSLLAAPMPVQLLGGCTAIRQSGVYRLDRDITGSVGSACLEIRDVSDVELDCQGHSITTDNSGLAALWVETARNFTIRSCRLPQLSGYSLYIGDSANGMITRNILRDMVVHEPNPQNAATLRVIGNEFSDFRSRESTPAGTFDIEDSVIPVTEGLNQILAQNLILAPAAETGPNPPPVATGPLAVRVYPNPWRSDLHQDRPITFNGLPSGAAIKLFTLSGRWVRSLTSSGVAVTWDLLNDSGDRVASGLYLYVITADPHQKTVGKLTIIR